MEVKDLWLQGLVKEGGVCLEKVRGDRNPADSMTKYQDRGTVCELLGPAGIEIVLAGKPGQAEGGCSNPRSTSPYVQSQPSVVSTGDVHCS